MALRIVEIVLPVASVDALKALPGAQSAQGSWELGLEDGDKRLLRLLVDAERSEGMLDDLQNRFSAVEGFRVIVLPVEATLPQPQEVTRDQSTAGDTSRRRISRAELYEDIAQSSNFSSVFVAQVILATLVVAVGLIRDDTAVIIGAMVIAPLLGPNMALSLATTLGDTDLAIRSLKVNAWGLAIAFGTCLSIGSILSIDPDIEAIRSRTHVSVGDIVLALSSGCAGALAFTTGVPTALIGVMVAVALLPPFAVFGLMIAAGDLGAASGALLLVTTNVICVNLAGVLTFLAQGLRPRTWWEAERAKKATRVAVVTWSMLLLVLVALILLAVRV